MFSSIHEHGSELELSFIKDEYENNAEYDIKTYKAITESSIHNMPSTLGTITVDCINMKTERLIKYIDAAMNNLESTMMNNNNLIDFFTNIQNGLDLMKCSFTTGIRDTNEIDKIRGQYLIQELTDMKTSIDSFINSKSSKSDIEDKFLTKSYVEKIKRQMVKTSLLLNDNYNNFAKQSKPNIVKVDGNFVSGPILDLLKNCSNVFEQYSQLTMQTKKYLYESSKELNTMIVVAYDAKEKIFKDDIKKCRDLDKLIYSFVRQYFETAAFLTHMTIRKISSVSYNLASYYELYNNIIMIYPQGGNFIHENTLDGNVNDIENDQMFDSAVHDNLGILTYNIDSILDKKRHDIAEKTRVLYNDLDIYNEIDIYANNYDYDKTVYDVMSSIFTDINKSIKIFIDKIQDGVIYDEALEASGLNRGLQDKYSKLLYKVDDLSDYKHDNTLENMMPLYNELLHYKDNTAVIGQEMNNTYNTIQSTGTSFNSTVNKENVSDITIKEVQDFLFELDIDFHDLVVLCARQLNNRISEVIDRVNGINCGINIDLNVSEATDYELDMLDETIVLYEAASKDVMTELIKDYKVKINRKITGLNIIYEATEDSSSNKLTSLKELIIGLLRQFRTKIGELTGANQKLLEDNKSKLLAINAEGLNIKLLPYDSFPISNIQKNIGTLISKISSIDKEKYNSLNAETVKNELFDFIPKDIHIGDSDNPSFSAIVKQYYAIGKMKPEVKVYEGTAAKQLINKMIDYCEKYKSITDGINNSLERLSDITDKKVLALNKKVQVSNSVSSNNDTTNKNDNANSRDNSSTKPSATIDQSKQQNSNNNSNDKTKTKVGGGALEKTISQYALAIPTALEARYVAYITLIRILSNQLK